jgi:hypothetical protein
MILHPEKCNPLSIVARAKVRVKALLTIKVIGKARTFSAIMAQR